MNEKYTYGPEDIEELLRSKAFDELYPEEKEYVLKHVSGKEEYSQLQDTLSNLVDSEEGKAFRPPDPKVKEALLKEFRVQHRQESGRPTWSLNSLFKWIENPLLRFAIPSLAIVVLMIGLWWVFPNDSLSEKAVAVIVEESDPMLEESDNSTNVVIPTEAEEVSTISPYKEELPDSEAESPSDKEYQLRESSADEEYPLGIEDDVKTSEEQAGLTSYAMEMDEELSLDDDVGSFSDGIELAESAEEMSEPIEGNLIAAPEVMSSERAVSTLSKSGSVAAMRIESEQELELNGLVIGLLYTAQ